MVCTFRVWCRIGECRSSTFTSGVWPARISSTTATHADCRFRSAVAACSSGCATSVCGHPAGSRVTPCDAASCATSVCTSRDPCCGSAQAACHTKSAAHPQSSSSRRSPASQHSC